MANFDTAGSSKTVLAPMVIESIGKAAQQQTTIYLCYTSFFGFNDRTKQKAEDLVRSLIWQLAAKIIQVIGEKSSGM